MSLSLDGANYFGVGKDIVPYRVNAGGIEMITGFNQSQLSGVRYGVIKQMLANTPEQALPAVFNQTTSAAIETSELLSAALQRAPALRTSFPNSRSGNALKMVATMTALAPSLGLNRQVFFIEAGGYDHHNAQVTAHANALDDVSSAMAAFYDATVELGLADKITTFTASDFGRTYVPNTDGTDHGWGNIQWIMGGAVRGGDIYGRMPSLQVGGTDDTGRGRWIPSTSVDEYNATLARWFGVSDTNLPVVLPNIGRFAKRDLGFMG